MSQTLSLGAEYIGSGHARLDVLMQDTLSESSQFSVQAFLLLALFNYKYCFMYI